jgi:hypothetical protein
VIKSKRVRWTGYIAYDGKWEIHIKFWTGSMNERVHVIDLGSCQSTWHHIPENSTLHPHYMISRHKTVLFVVITVRTWDSTFCYSSEDSKPSVQLHHCWFNDLMMIIGDEEYRVWNSLFCSILHGLFVLQLQSVCSCLVTNILLRILFSSLIAFIIKYPSNKNVLDLD